MRALPLVVALVFLAPSALAADVAVRLGLAGTPFYDQPNELVVAVTNHGPERATSVVVTVDTAVSDDARCVQEGGRLRCELSSLGAQQTVEVRARHHFRGNAGNGPRIEANVTTTARDPDPSNNQHVLFYVPVLPAAEVVTDIRIPAAFNADGTITIRYDIRNQHVEFPATLLAKISIPEATEFVGANADCHGTAANLECTLPVPASTTFPLDVTVRFADPAGRLTTKLLVYWAGYPELARSQDASRAFARKLLVTTADDDGAGSLRAAIIEANARCTGEVPCLIHFAIADPVPAGGWFSIRPRAPLPQVTGRQITIDGTTQTAFSGDTNPLGPEILLDGSALVTGNGLSFSGPIATVSGLAIGNFPDNGIYSAVGAFISSSYIGVDPTGTRAMPNYRGITTGSGGGTISKSVISGNVRSGIALWNVLNAQIHDNRIGVAAATDDPIPNGATGVFIGGGVQGMFGGAGIFRNVIANNGEFGVAYPRDVWGHLGPNRIYANGLGGIDIDLDGPSPELGPVPVITRAYWDGMATVIEGTTPPWTSGQISERFQVLLFANRELEAGGYAEGERHFGTVSTDEFGRFTLRYGEDLRGLYVNGITVRRTFFYGEYEQARTSEFGQAVRVTGQP